MSSYVSLRRILNVIKAVNDRDIYLIFEYMETDLHAVCWRSLYSFAFVCMSTMSLNKTAAVQRTLSNLAEY